MNDVATRLQAIHDRIGEAARRSGRTSEDIALVAVSKTHPPESIREAFGEGQKIFGENRVQELLSKAPLLPSSIRWHLLGHLQSNKIRKVLPVCELIHGVDSLELALDIDRIAGELGLFPRILLEVNVSGEGTKFGFKPDVLRSELETLLALPKIQIDGLMTIAPYTEEPEQTRPVFGALRELRDKLAVSGGAPLTTLSMGMSGDFEIAIEEGSTLVRVGTAIFGERPKAKAD